MSRRRTIGLLVAVGSFGLFLFSGAQMARAVAAHYEQAGRELFAFQHVEQTRFTYADRLVSIEDGVGDAGQLIVTLTYGDREVNLIPTIEPGPADLPALTRHKDWLRVMLIAPARGLSKAQFDAGIASGEITPRLVVLVRRPPPGADENTYAKVWRSEWRYEFNELLPDGDIRRDILRHAADAENPDAGELAPGSWQFEAAEGSWGFDPMSVMAPHASPSAMSAREAVEASGWALPVTSLSLLACVVSLAVGFAPDRRVRPANGDASP